MQDNLSLYSVHDTDGLIAAVRKTTSDHENGQTHDGSHIYTHDRHCRAVLPVPADAERATLAIREAEDGQCTARARETGKPGDEASQT